MFSKTGLNSVLFDICKIVVSYSETYKMSWNCAYYLFLVSEAPPPPKTEKQVETPVGIMFEGEVALESSLAFLQNSKEKEERVSCFDSEKYLFNI